MEPEKLSLYKTPLQLFKRVSGSLRRLNSIAAQAQAPVLHLLVVDDEASICFAMSEYFSQHGFSVDTTTEMDEAERLISGTNYEVIIQDLRFGSSPRYGGLDIIKLVHKRNPDTRIVVLTSYGTREIEAEARSAGAHAFLRKPKPLSQVAQVIQGLIESPRARRRTGQ